MTDREVEPDKTNLGNNTLPLEWPKIRWRIDIWWAIIPGILTFIIFFFPQLTKGIALSSIRLVIGIPLLLMTLLAPIFLWIWRITRVIIQRVKSYPELHSRAQQAINDFDQLRKSYFVIAMQIADGRQFEIIKAGFHEDKLLIVLRRKKAPKVNQGDKFVVVDKKDEFPMGIFQATEIRTQEIYAEGISNIDAVWLGYVRQIGEMSITPNLTAILVPQEKK